MSKKLDYGLAIVLIVVGAFVLHWLTGINDTPSKVAATTTAATSVVKKHDNHKPKRPGNQRVYSEIASTTDCDQLQEKFNTAAANHVREAARGNVRLMKITTSYMEAADDRMSDVGCY